MEYVRGATSARGSCKATLAASGARFPLSIAVSIACGVLRGLHAAHEAKSDKGEPLGLIHRDISPQNVLVGIDGVPRVIDFGIAKAADSVQFTRDGELKGKLSYMAPEQLNGHRCTRRTDIYSASVILWEVLTAQRLFDADYQSAILKNILHRPIDPPSDSVPDLPKALRRHRCSRRSRARPERQVRLPRARWRSRSRTPWPWPRNRRSAPGSRSWRPNRSRSARRAWPRSRASRRRRRPRGPPRRSARIWFVDVKPAPTSMRRPSPDDAGPRTSRGVGQPPPAAGRASVPLHSFPVDARDLPSRSPSRLDAAEPSRRPPEPDRADTAVAIRN